MITTEQSLAALEVANARRVARAAFKRELAAIGSLSDCRELVADLLDQPVPEHLETMKVYDLLRAMYKAGPSMANRWLKKARIGSNVRLGQLTDRQAGALQVLLRAER